MIWLFAPIAAAVATYLIVCLMAPGDAAVIVAFVVLVLGMVLWFLTERVRRLKKLAADRTRRRAAPGKASFDDVEMAFLGHLFAMMAKMAKADGHVDASEVAMAEKVFAKFDFAAERRDFCRDVFNKAMHDSMTIYEYAKRFCLWVADGDVRAFMYELLWDVACADGCLHGNEKKVLAEICKYLGLGDDQFNKNYRRRFSRFSNGPATGTAHGVDGNVHEYRSGTSTLNDAYSILGCTAAATGDELKSAYRSAAKRYHPDMLRANGIPETMIASAVKKMEAVNAAWADIRKARGL